MVRLRRAEELLMTAVGVSRTGLVVAERAAWACNVDGRGLLYQQHGRAAITQTTATTTTNKEAPRCLSVRERRICLSGSLHVNGSETSVK